MLLEKKRQIQVHAKEVLSCCVDKEVLKAIRMNYFKGNTELAIDVLNLLDGIWSEL